MKEKIEWINTIKALCMIGVYILHTQAYMGAGNGGGYNALIYNIISPFYVNAFFVVSGYLFFMKWSDITHDAINRSVTKSLGNTLFRLIIPTVLFSTLIYIPKLLFHARELSLTGYLHDVLGGVSYWFTSAMAVCHLVMLLMIFCRVISLRGFSVVSIIIIFLIALVKPLYPDAFPWYWKTGMTAVAFMTLGGWGYRLRDRIIRYRNPLTIISIVCYLIAVCYGFVSGDACYAMMSVNFNLAGIAVTLAGTAFVFMISCRIVRRIRFLQFIGNNSIVFYFFSGVIPAMLSSIATLRGTGVIVLSIISVAFGATVTWFIVKYMPFMTDLRKLQWIKGLSVVRMKNIV